MTPAREVACPLLCTAAMNGETISFEDLQAAVSAEREAVLWLRSEVRALERYAAGQPKPWRAAAFAAAVVGVVVAVLVALP